jgi:hypothetical protein
LKQQLEKAGIDQGIIVSHAAIENNKSKQKVAELEKSQIVWHKVEEGLPEKDKAYLTVYDNELVEENTEWDTWLEIIAI